MTEERAPDHTHDPHSRDVADQLPEEGPEGQTPREGDDQGPETGTGGANAPDTTGGAEGDAPGGAGEGSQSTGNPHAAG